MDAAVYALCSVGVVSLTSFVGIVVLTLDRAVLATLLMYLVSFAAGTLFGDVFFHLFPTIAASTGFDARTGFLVLVGVFLAYGLETYVSWHHHHHPTHGDEPEPVAYTILFGDAVHNMIDGIVIAVSYFASIPVGVATTVAVLFHELPQEIGDVAILLHGGVPRRRALAYNFLSALTAIAGTLAVLIAGNSVVDLTDLLLPVAAGNFVYIAGTDLLPELKRETRAVPATLQMVAVAAGVGVLYLLTFLD